MLDELGYRELGRLPVIANHRNRDRLRLVILPESPIAPSIDAGDFADSRLIHAKKLTAGKPS